MARRVLGVAVANSPLQHMITGLIIAFEWDKLATITADDILALIVGQEEVAEWAFKLGLTQIKQDDHPYLKTSINFQQLTIDVMRFKRVYDWYQAQPQQAL